MRTAYALHRPVENAYLVRERDRRRWRDLLVVLLAVVPLALALLFYTRIHLDVLETGYEIGVLERKLEKLTQQEQELRSEAARLESPARLEKIAREQLGLVSPSIEQMLFVQGSPP